MSHTPVGVEGVQQLIERWRRVDADDAKARGYLEAWNTYQVCANELEALALRPASQLSTEEEDTRVEPPVVAQERQDLPRKPQPDGSQRQSRCCGHREQTRHVHTECPFCICEPAR